MKRTQYWVIALFMTLSFPVIGGENTGCKAPHSQCGHEQGDGSSGDISNYNGVGDVTGGSSTGGSVGDVEVSGTAEASATSEAEAVATADSVSGAEATATGGAVGDITINGPITNVPASTSHTSRIKLENTPDMVTFSPGSGDDCKAHIGASLAIPGLGTGLTIPLPGKECRKLKYFDRMMASGQHKAAEIIFCSLKEVRIEFKEMALNCIETLTIYVEPQEVAAITLKIDVEAPPVREVSQLTDERYLALKTDLEATDAVQQKIDIRQEQQQAILESQAQELAKLSREAKALRDEQEAQRQEELSAQEKFAKRLAAKETKGD